MITSAEIQNARADAVRIEEAKSRSARVSDLAETFDRKVSQRQFLQACVTPSGRGRETRAQRVAS